MSKVVLDSSAFLAFANREPGADRVRQVLGQAYLSTVNVSEVFQKLIKKGLTLASAEDAVHRFIPEFVAFDLEQATMASALASQTDPFGLSLGDRACLALGKSLNALVLTADRAWANLEIGVQIELIRNSAS